MPQKCCAAGPEKSRRPTQQALRMISHILQLRISNIYAQATSTIFSIHAHMHFQRNIYSTAQLFMVSTSTAQLLASQDINRLFRLCVHPGPASSHISQPLVASFDKTATAPQTEQQ